MALTLRGTPFLYEGEELGLLDAAIPPERKLDPVDRDGCRAPVPWTTEEHHGWGREPWLPFPPESTERSVAAERDDPGSVLHLYRRLLAERKRSTALRRGAIDLLVGWPEPVIAWDRHHGDERRRVVVSFATEPIQIEAGLVESGGPWRVVVASDGEGEGLAFTGHLEATQAVILVPAR